MKIRIKEGKLKGIEYCCKRMLVAIESPFDWNFEIGCHVDSIEFSEDLGEDIKPTKKWGVYFKNLVVERTLDKIITDTEYIRLFFCPFCGEKIEVIEE